jgi:hypothetical protein
MPPSFIKFLTKLPKVHTNEMGLEHYKIGKMWNKTRVILDDFFQPMNEALVDILKDKSFLFKRL